MQTNYVLGLLTGHGARTGPKTLGPVKC